MGQLWIYEWFMKLLEKFIRRLHISPIMGSGMTICDFIPKVEEKLTFQDNFPKPLKEFIKTVEIKSHCLQQFTGEEHNISHYYFHLCSFGMMSLHSCVLNRRKIQACFKTSNKKSQRASDWDALVVVIKNDLLTARKASVCSNNKAAIKRASERDVLHL